MFSEIKTSYLTFVVCYFDSYVMVTVEIVDINLLEAKCKTCNEPST